MSLGNELITLEKANLLYKDLRERSAPVIFNSAVGNPAVFSDGADGLPIQSLKAHLLPRQEGTGDPSPENIRSIIPWNGLSVNQCTINLFNEEQLLVDGISFVDGYYTGTRQAFYVAFGRNGNKFALPPFKPNTQYTLTATGKNNTDTGGSWIVIHYTDNSTSSWIKIEGIEEQTKTVTTNAGKTISHIDFTYPRSSDTVLSIKEIMFEEGTMSSAYIPYRPITDTDIVFPSPVYGGELEAVSGKLMDGWKTQTFDGSSDEVWYFVRVGTTEYYRAYINMPDARQSNDIAILADSYKAVSFDDRNYSNKMCFMGNESETPIIFALVTDLTTIEAFKAYLAENPLTICYQLAIPVEVQLTPSQLKTLLGNNTIWSDANGGMEVEYRVDTEKFVEKALADIPIASASVLGLVQPRGNAGIYVTTQGNLCTDKASLNGIKAGTSAYNPVVPELQHASAFYGLSKAAGIDMAQSSNPVGTYTSAAKHAIQNMIGLSGILGDYESTGTANKAYAIGDTFIFEGARYRVTTAIAIDDVIAPGTNCELAPIDGHYVRDTDYATSSKAGVVQTASWAGVEMNGYQLRIFRALESDIKTGTHAYRPITPSYQHESAFFGLSKAAGIDLANVSDVIVGTYPQESQTAIQTMLGVPSTSDLPVFATKAETEEIITEWNGDIIPSAQGVSF